MLARFWRDRRGATAVMMSISLVPIMSTLAISVDYSSAIRQRSVLQQVVDSTATALAKDTDVLLLTQDQLTARAIAYANAVTSTFPVENLNLTVKASDETVSVDASGTTKLVFAKMLGQGEFAINASVTVQRAKARKIELALALDNTGSMSGTKISELKKAITGLVDFMSDTSQNSGPTKISLVPFTNYVRTDKTYMLNSYLEATPPGSWDGCVTDRDQPNDVTDVAPGSGGIAQRHRFKKYGSTINCGGLAKIVPLTSDLAQIKSAANTMIATGSTNVPIGLYWAWNTLTTTAPMTQASPKDTKDLIRAMIVLTDGDNTSNYWGGNGGGAIDKRMALVCNNIKADGIVLYTIRVINGNATALKSCASSATHYFNIKNAGDMTPVFKQIASSLSKLRITR